MVYLVRIWFLLAMVAACDLPGTNVPPDAGTTVEFRLALTSRYADPAIALEGLEIWADGEGVARQGELQHLQFPDMDEAKASETLLEVRYGGRVIDRLSHSPGDVCTADRGDGNRLLTETVNLCVRANGELQLNDFSCEYEESGYFTADVFCPTDCHPLFGTESCAEERCGLVLSSARPRFGQLQCVAIGELGPGEPCPEVLLGSPDACGQGLACVTGECRPFCLSDSECPGEDRCVSALRGEAEPLVCVDGDSAPVQGPASL